MEESDIQVILLKQLQPVQIQLWQDHFLQVLRNLLEIQLFITDVSSKHTEEWDQLKPCSRVQRTGIFRILKMISENLFLKELKQEFHIKELSLK